MKMRSLFHPRLRASTLWVWGALLNAFIICTVIFMLHGHQQRQLTLATARIHALGQAAGDLSKGFLHLTLGGVPESPWQVEQGYSLVLQALDELDRSGPLLPIDPSLKRALALESAAFRHQLVRQVGPPSQRPPDELTSDLVHPPELQSAVYHLKSNIARVDNALRRDLETLSTQMELEFRWSLGLTLALLLLVSVGVFRSERARAMADEGLRESEERFRGLIEQSIVGILILQEGRIAYVNPFGAMIFGSTPNTLTGTRLRDLVIQSQQERLEQELNSLLETGTKVVSSQYVGQSPNQRELIFEIASHRATLHGRQVIISVMQDITERRRVEQEKLAALRLLEVISDSSTDAIFAKDLQGRYLLFNREACRVTGRSLEQILGRDDRSAFPPEEAEMIIANDARVMQENVTRTYEETLTTTDGQVFYLATKGPLHDADGKVIGMFGISRNISARIRAEHALRTSEEKYRSMVSALSEGVLIFDLEARVLACNPSAERILGLTFDEMKASRQRLSDWNPLAPDGTPFPVDEIPLAHTLATGESHHKVLLGHVNPLGKTSWLETSSVPVHDPVTGCLTSVVVSFTDVTAQFSAEQELRRLSLAVAQNPNSIVITDLAGRIEYTNEAFERHSGYRSAEVLGRDQRLLYPERSSPSTQDDMWQALEKGMDWKGEITRPNRGGEARIKAVQAAPIRQPGGRITHFLITEADITEAKKLEAELERHRHHLEELVASRTAELHQLLQALVEAEQFLRTIADNIPGLVAYWNKRLRNEFANRVCTDWYGKTPEQIRGRPIQELLSETAYAEVLPHIERVLQGEPQRFEGHLITPSGETVISLTHYIPDIREGDVRGFFVLMSDITEPKQAEQHLQHLNNELIQARDRAEHANRAKSGFLANMSHEIRTPLNAIIGLTHLLQRDSQSGLQRERLGKVSDAAYHLLAVINNILDLSKIESGKLTLEQIDFSLEDMLSRTLALVSDQARDKGIELVLSVGRVPRVLRGDPTRLSQALLNLLANAVKFTEQGAVTLRCEQQEASSEGIQLYCEVRDTGCGIPPEKLSRLFGAFEQADSSTTRRYGGSGLGLAITRHLAQLMGGEAGATSALGIGSRFWITVQVGTATPEPLPVNLPILAGRRTLLIDDLTEARDAVSAMLRRLGLLVNTAASGAQALELFEVACAEGNAYELIVLDLQMPDLDGIVTAERIRARAGATPPRCVLLCPHEDERLRSRAMEAGIHQLLLKPLSLATLSERLPEVFVGAGLAPHLTATGTLGEAVQQLHSGACVLLAEDDALNREVTTELLRSVGLVVDVAENGAQAVQMAQHAAYNLILMDVQMPELDGLEATRAIRAGRVPAETGVIAAETVRTREPSNTGSTTRSVDAKRIPILAMTANAFEGDRHACLAAGMNDHITKPVNPRALYEALLRWLPTRALRMGPSSTAGGISALGGLGEAGLEGPEGAAAHALAPNPHATRLPGDWRQQLGQLETLLATGDFDALALHRELVPTLTTLFDTDARRIALPLERYHFEEALTAFRSLLHTLDSA